MDELEQYIHEQSFAGYISFASGNDDAISAFESDTGFKLSMPRSPIEAMIDKQTGYQREVVSKFIDWCADQYGRDFLPSDLSVFMKPETTKEK